MSKSNTTENDVLKAVLQGTDPSWRAGASLYLAFYTADPDETGTATTNETAYTNYARQTITKATGWTDGGSSFTNSGLIQFPQCGASGATLTHVALVSTSSGAGQIFYSGALNSPLAVANLIQPQFAIGALTITED
jgi:hypothetical protein